MVTTFSVITSSTLISASVVIMGIISLLLIIPMTCISFTTGRPFTPSSSIIRLASYIDAFGSVVITSLMVRSPEFFTFLTSSTCSLTVIFRCITPKPPSCAMLIAISASVTVSMAELIMGMLIFMLREIRVLVSTFFGSTVDSQGTIKKSSKVNPSGAFLSFRVNIY